MIGCTKKAPLLALLLALLLQLVSQSADAHTRSRSFSLWQRDGNGVQVRLTVAARDLTALRAFAPARALRLHAAGRACDASVVTESTAPTGYRAFAWSLRCPSGNGWRIHSDLLVDTIPSHLHFARVAGHEQVFDARTRSNAWYAPQSGGWQLARAGAAHVLSGWDHLVFLLLLAMLVTSRRTLLALVTGFTLGHGLSLTLVTVGWLDTHPATVEALIGGSVLLLAAELAWRGWPSGNLPTAARDSRAPRVASLLLLTATAIAWYGGRVHAASLVGLTMLGSCYFMLQRRRDAAWRRVFVTVLFGCLHGLGFAKALATLPWPQTNRAWSLVAFNCGVEVAQLAVVAAALLLLARLRRSHLRRAFGLMVTATTACAGSYWLLTRSLWL